MTISLLLSSHFKKSGNLFGLITFDLGPSYRILGMSVNEMISNGFPTSAKIGGIAAILIIVVGVVCVISSVCWIIFFTRNES